MTAPRKTTGAETWCIINSLSELAQLCDADADKCIRANQPRVAEALLDRAAMLRRLYQELEATGLTVIP